MALAVFLLASCRGEALPTSKASTTPTGEAVQPSLPSATPVQAYPPAGPEPATATSVPSVPTSLPGYPEPAAEPSVEVSAASPAPSIDAGMGGYPGPDVPTLAVGGVTATATATATPYPDVEDGYPGPATAVPPVAPPPPGDSTSVPAPTASPSPWVPPTAPAAGTQGTPTAVPTEFIGRPVQSPPSPGTTVRIWHAWQPVQSQVLTQVISSFQDVYPDVYFDVLYMPQEELRERYEAEAYRGRGPSLLLGPADWGVGLYDGALVADLSPSINPQLLGVLSLPALGTVQYQGAQICLPYAIEGVVLYRNTSLVPKAPETFDELVTLAGEATRAGNLGAFLERGAYFSLANLNGLGGQWMDANGDPAFNDAGGLAWLDLLSDYDRAGTATFNNQRDLELFMDGRIGFIIDGTWSMRTLEAAIGSENLAIDPWPAYQDGHMAGFVGSECAYLNSNSRGDEQYAALVFMGYLLNNNVQHLLAEVELIPAVLDAAPRNPLLQQAMTALEGGAAIPPMANERYWYAYLDAMDQAIEDVFEQGVDPAAALQDAYDTITARLLELRAP